MDTLNFKITPLGQTVLRYEVPLDVYNIINQIYEMQYPTLPRANKQLVGKIEKEHSLFFGGQDTDKMKQHNPCDKNMVVRGLDLLKMILFVGKKYTLLTFTSRDLIFVNGICNHRGNENIDCNYRCNQYNHMRSY